MKKLTFVKRIGLLALAAFLLSTCLTNSANNRLSDVHLGMSTYEVSSVAGPPDRVLEHAVPSGRRVEWIYLSHDHQSVLMFENDVLIAIKL